MNIFRDECICYYFKNSKKLSKKDRKDFKDLNIYKELKKVNKKLGIEKLLVKYDVIISNGQYVILDIGLDPQRMLNSFKNKKIFINFNKIFYKSLND